MRVFWKDGIAAGFGRDFPRGSILGDIETDNIEYLLEDRHLYRWYGVSTGDGNNGVSHMFPDYYVWTNDPWELARRASESDTKPEYRDRIEIDGEAEYVISAVIYDDPDLCDDYDPDEDYSDWEAGAAPYILEVFPADIEDIERARENPYGKFCYQSINEALGAE